MSKTSGHLKETFWCRYSEKLHTQSFLIGTIFDCVFSAKKLEFLLKANVMWMFSAYIEVI
jgi:hypothetical protein